MRILYKFTSRSRPTKFFNTLDNIVKLARHKDYLILVTLDVDDTSMANKEVRDKLKKYKNLKAYWGKSKNKVDAINRDMGFAGKWDILVNVSDDQLFLVKGFDKIIIRDMKKYFPNLDGLLHYPDSHAKDQLPTMAIMGRKYYEIDGYIYNPIYNSTHCDLESMRVAQKRKKRQYVDTTIFDHFHPAWGMAPMDAQYKFTESFYHTDHLTFCKREAAGFP